MEYLDGPSMDRRQPRTFDEALVIYQQSAAALRHMHDRGFVHADMKPNNIVVMPGPTAKIIDLGQSCKIGTIKPRIQGTPDFIAPEQVHRREITPRTDVYNLGAAMYFTFTGKTIPTALAKPDALISRIDDSLLAKPTPAGKLNARVPPMLSDLIMQCVEVDAEQRPESMGIVADKLQLILGMMRARTDQVVAESARINSETDSGTIHHEKGSSGQAMRLPEVPRSASSDDVD
jgi:serine/threonine-protein kinase